MIALDASVLIAYFDAGDRQHERAMALLVREIDDEFALNLLTLAEAHNFTPWLLSLPRAEGPPIIDGTAVRAAS